ncbi:MAG: bifunctional (p)ppGpp synthetase/guanosine-3',5'-bis(diphosphate) 3'-pyrophosphohydrolase [Proteobacteria bacterium]|nr:bifunctional (p)ppGpp synthetase/guanosine-3',5'-bis(diphosphate) 3'-pyrophosphohydrolase [Pseudomonadota bacterium]
MIRLDQILDNVRAYAPDADLGLLRKAWVYAQKHHAGQTRKSGEPYFAHPLEVANILADLRMDTDTLAAAILHDTVEDTDATLDDIGEKFSPDISELVDGVTKLDKLDFRTAEEAQAENFRKLVLAMSRDIRVIVIKLADRLHNMQTLEAMRPDKRVRIAQETMDLYAPIANRLGIVSIKGELEDLSFRYLHEDVYAELERQVEARRPWFEAYIERVKEQLVSEIEGAYPGAEISGRVKRLWSIWLKMQSKQLTFEEVHDLLAFRITVENVTQCYGALGMVHGLWTPQSEKFKDYIAQPKANGYQSLHTTVIGPEAQRIEVQIRTEEMHRFGEFGIAAHWKYKEGKLALKKEEIEKYTKVRQLLRWAEDIEDSREFLDVLKVDLYADQVYVYTPRGDVKWFPRGSTPLDFAYAIHTEVGNHCAGARINGRMVKLNYPLRSGDTIEVLQKNDQHPKKDWLQMAKTSRALSKIRQHLRNDERKQAVEVGKRLLDQELRKHGKSLKAVVKKDDLQQALEHLHLQNPIELYQGIGYGRLDVERILPYYVEAEKLSQDTSDEIEEIQTTTLSRLFKRLNRRGGSPVKIDGQDGMLTVFAKCCRPLPGDPILGYITVGRGITVHASNCPQALALGPERRVEVEWDTAHKAPHQARIHVVTVDRPMMLAELTKAIGKLNVNITSADIRTTKEDRGLITLDVAVNDATQLRQMMSHLERLKGVISVDRVRVGGPA